MDRKYETAFDHFASLRGEGDFSSIGPREFLNLFPGGKTIQTFDDKGKDRSLAQLFYFSGSMSNVLHKELMRLNRAGAGIFFCVGETDGNGRKKENVTKVRAAFADLDGVPIETAIPYKPTVIVESSPGKFHCYWVAIDVPLEAFTVQQKNIARIFGSDPKVCDLPRVMRVPGFYHLKSAPFLTRVWGGTGNVLTYRDLVEWFPPEPREQWTHKRYKVYSRSTTDQTIRPWKYGSTAGERNAHVLHIIGGMIKRGCDWNYIVDEAMKDGRSCTPPLDDHEIQQILRSAQRYAKGGQNAGRVDSKALASSNGR